jgi:hypothetical protein
MCSCKGRWGGGDPWLGALGGLSLVGLVVVTLYVVVFRVRGAPPPLFVGMSSFFFNAFGIGRVGLLSQK